MLLLRYGFSRSQSMMVSILQAVLRMVMPLQFDHSFTSPFLKIGHITLIFHSGGRSSSPPAFRYSAGIPSDPGLLLFLSRLTAKSYFLVSSMNCHSICCFTTSCGMEYWQVGRDFNVPIEQIIKIFYTALCDVSWIRYQGSRFTITDRGVRAFKTLYMSFQFFVKLSYFVPISNSRISRSSYVYSRGKTIILLKHLI